MTHEHESDASDDGRSSSGNVDRITRVLDCFFSRQEPMSLTTVARTAGLPKSTTHRLLGALVERDLVRRCGVAYTLGGHWQHWRLDLREEHRRLRGVAIPHLTELFVDHRLITTLAVMNGDLLVTSIAMLYAHSHLPLMAHRSDRTPAERTAAGKVLLAFDTRAGHATAASDHGVDDVPEDLFQELSQVRRKGVAFSEDKRCGITACAAPIFGRKHLPLAALSVAGARHEFSATTAERAVRTTAHVIARDLGRSGMW